MFDEIIKMDVVKLAVLGGSSVGKTSIINTFQNIIFSEDIISTLGTEKFEKKITINNDHIIKLVIWDTDSHKRFRKFLFKSIKAIQGIF